MRKINQARKQGNSVILTVTGFCIEDEFYEIKKEEGSDIITVKKVD